MATVLLINPSYLRAYGTSPAAAMNPVFPVLGLAALAAAVRARGHQPEILDLSYQPYDPAGLKEFIGRRRPDFVGITATTPLVNQLRDLSFLVKDISEDIITIAGGPHASALPVETLQESRLDVLVAGEGDTVFPDIIDGKPLGTLPGVYWRRGDTIEQSPDRSLVENLDDLPLPAWDLFPIDAYRRRYSKVLVRNPPPCTVEFSRGCLFGCDYCASKNTMGFGHRRKSPERCADEFEHLEKLGYREALLTDDIFTSNRGWAIQVCEAIIRRNLKMIWTCTNGIRVDSATDDLFRVMKRAGCYRVHFGFESGNDRVLKAFGKGGRASLAQGIAAVAASRRAGLDTWGMYMLGLSADDEASMRDTIDFAKKTHVDVAKFSICIPFPGSKMFDQLHREGKIKTYDWDEYNVANEVSAVCEHPTLSWDTIRSYYRKAYFELYLANPAYVLRRLWRSLRRREIFRDLWLGLGFLFQIVKRPQPALDIQYAFRNRWEPLNVVPPRHQTYVVPKVMIRRAIPGQAHG